MQEDFNQENINPDLDQETSNLGIDLTLDSEENQIQGIEASDSVFSDLDYFNAPPPVTPEEVELFNLSDQETKAKENFNKKKQDLYEVKLSGNKVNKKIESLNEEGEEDEISLDGFDRSTFDKIDLEIKSKYGEDVSIKTILNYMISKRDKLEKDFEEEFEKEIGFKYSEWDEKGSIVGPTGRSMAQAILDDFKEDAKAYDKERQEVLDIINSYNKLATEEGRKRELNKIKSKGISKDHQPGDAVEMKDNIVLLFEYKKDKDGKINRVLKQEFDYDELEKRYVKSGGWETVEDFMFNYNKKSGAYSSRQIKKGGVLAFEYVGINQPRLIEKKYWGEPLKDNLGNDVVFQEPIKIMPFLMELEVVTKAKPDFIIVPEDKYRVVSTDFGGYTREEFNNLPKAEKDKIYEESEKKYREEVEPKRRIEREDFWDNLFDDSKFWRREEDVAAQMYSQLLPGKFKVEEDGEEYIKITNTTNGASVTIATDLEGFDQTEKYKEKSKLTNFLVNNTTSQDVDQAKKYVEKSIFEYNVLTSTPHTEGGLDLTQSEYEKIGWKASAVLAHEIRLQHGGAYLEYAQRTASSGENPYEEYYSIRANIRDNLLRFNRNNGIEPKVYLQDKGIETEQKGTDAIRIAYESAIEEEAKYLAVEQYKKVLIDREKEKVFEKYYEGKGGLKGKAKALVGDLLLTDKLETKQDKAEIQFHQSSSAVEKFDTHYIETLQKLIKNDDGFGNKIKGSGSSFEKNTQNIEEGESYYKLDNGLKVPTWLYDRAINDQMQLENLHTKAVDDYNHLLETIKQVDNFDSQWEILTKNYNDFEAFFVKAGLSIADAAVGLTHSLNYFAEFINPVTLTLKAFGINDPLDMDKAAMAWGETKNDIINSYASVSYEDKFDSFGSFVSFHTHLVADQAGNLMMGALLPTSIGGLGYGLTSFSAKRADMMTLMTNGDANYSATELFWKPFFFGAAEGVFGAAGQIKVTKNVLGTLKKSKDVLDDLYKGRFDYIKTNFLKTDGVLDNMFIEGVTEGLTQGTQNVIDGVSFWKDVDVASYSGLAVAGGMSTSAVFSTSIMKDFTGEKELKRIYELNQKIDSIQRRISEIEYGVVGGNVGDLKLEKQRLTQEGDLLVDEVNDIISGVENNLIKKSIEKEAGDMHIKNMLKLSEIRTKVDDVLKDESLSDSNKKDQIDELRKDYINIKRETDVFTDTNTWGSGWNALKGAQYYTLDRNKRKEYKEIRNKAIDNIKRRRGQEQFFTTEKITEEQIDAEAKEVYIEKRVDENRDKALKLFKKLKLEGLSVDIMTFDTKEEAVEYLDNIYNQLLEGETNAKTIESIEKERKLAVEGVKQGLVNGFKSSKYDQEISVRENAIKNKMAGTEFHELWHTMSAYLQSIDPEAFEEFSLQVQAYLTTYQPKILSRMIAKNSTLKESIERGELDYDEFNASFFEMVAEGRVDLNKIPNFAVVLGQIYNDGIRKGYGLEEGIAFQGENDIVNFFTALGVERKKGVFNKLAKFKKPRKIKISKKPKAKVKPEETKFSKTEQKQLGDDISSLVPEGTTKDKFDSEVIGNVYLDLVAGNKLDGLIRSNLAKYGVTGDKIYGKPIDIFIEDVKLKLYEKSIQRFNPEKNDDFGGFIISELVNYRIGDVVNDYKKLGQEARMPQYEGQDIDYADSTDPDDILDKIDEQTEEDVKIKLKEQFGEEGEIIHNKAKSLLSDKDLSKLDFKSLKGVTLSEVQEMFGISPKPGNLTRTDNENAQEFIKKNWKTLLAVLPEGSTPSGTSTGVQKVLLNKFYEKNDRVKLAKTGSAAGLAEQVKRDNITKEEFLDAFDISSTDENLIDRDGRGSTSSKIKALVAQVDRMFANQAARESAMEKGEHIPSKIWEGKSEIMFSMANSSIKFSSITKLQDLVTAETDNIIDNNLSFEDALDQADNDISKIVIKLLHEVYPGIFGDPTYDKTKQILSTEIKKRGSNSLSGQLLNVAIDDKIELNTIRAGIIALLNTAKKEGIIEKQFVDELIKSNEINKSTDTSGINIQSLLNLFFFDYNTNLLDARKEKRIKSETSIELSKVKEKKRKRENTNRDLIKGELSRLKKLKNGVVDSFKVKGVDIDASVKIDEKTYKKLEQKFKKVKELIDENSPAKVVENALNDYESELNKIVDEHFEKLKEPVKRNKDAKDRLKTKIKIHILGYPTKVGEKSKAYPQERLKRGYNILVDQDNKIDLLEKKIASETPIALLDKNGNPKKGDQYDYSQDFIYGGGFIQSTSGEDFSIIEDSRLYISNKGFVKNEIIPMLTSEETSLDEKIDKYNELSSEIQRANIANKELLTHALRIQYDTLLKVYNNTKDFSKFKNGVWTGWVQGLNANANTMTGFKAFASLDISQIKQGMSEMTLEHIYPFVRIKSDIITTFSDGIVNGKSWEDIQNDVSKIADKNIVAVLEKSTAKKLDDKLGKTVNLDYARLFAILKEIPSLYRVNSDKISKADRIAQIKEMFITKEFLETLGEKVKAINDKELSFSKVVKPDASMTNQDVLSLAATIDAVLNLARDPNTPVKKIRIFDFDDTLAQTKSNVLYTMPDGTKGKLTAEEFAKKGDAMAAKGAQWDFSEFNKVMQGKKGPLFNIAERIQRARGTEDLFVLTARAPEAALAIKEFLDSVGLNIPIENITGLGNSSPFAKSQWVIEKAADGYNDFYFADDHIANVEAVQDALDQLTDVKARTQIAIVSDEAVIEEQNMNKSIDSLTEEGSEGLLDIRFSKKNRDLYIKQLTKRRKDLLPEEIVFNVNQVFKFVDNLDVPQNKKKKFEKLALHYLANGYIILPEDGYKVIAAEKIARIKKVDPFSFKNPNEILELMPDELAKNSFNPDETESFTNKKVLSNGVVVYDVAYTDQGQKDVRLAIDRDFGKKANPWCLAQKNEKGELSSDAKRRWQSYNGNGKGAGYKIAFQNGKLTALRDGSEQQWWDRMDRPSEGIPITRKTKDGWTEHVPVNEDGTEGKVRAKTKGNKNNGRYMEMTSADQLMYGSSNDFELVEDMTYKDGEPMDGFIKNYGSEDNFSLQEYVGGVKVKSIYDSSSEFVNNNMNEIAYFGDKVIKIKVDKAIEEDILTEKGKRGDQIIRTIEGVDDNGNKIVYNNLQETKTGGLAYPINIYKELNGDKYLTQWDLNLNELIRSVIYQTKNLTKDQLETEYLKTNAAKVMSLEDFKSKGYSYDYLKSAIRNYKFAVGKAALDKNDKKIVIPVDEEGYSLKFSMNTRMDLDWKKTERPGPSWQTEPSIGYRTEFKVDDKTYQINIAKLFESESLGILNEVLSRDDIFEVKGDYYEVDFAYIDEKGLPRTDQTGLAGRQGGKVLSIVTNGVLEFAKENKVAGLYFTSAAPKRSRIYKVLSDIFGSELGWGNKMKTDKVMGVKTDNFIVSQDVPVKKVNKERKPVRDVLRVIDKSSQIQTDLRFSKANLDKDFNKIIEESSGIEWYKEFSPVKAKVRGAKKGRYKFFLPPSAEDFLGLVYNTLGKGKVGEAQLDWYKEYLFNPYTRAIENLSKDRANLMKDFKALKKALRVPKDLRKKTDSGFTKEQAVRVYLWNKTGQEVPGISKTDLKELVDIINSDETLKAFGDQILEVTKGDGYSKPGKNWLAGTITTDLIDLLNTTKRAKYLQEWQENVDEIYSEKNLSKLEAAYGPKYVEALKNILARMKSGKNRIAGGNRLSNGVLNYINQGQGAIMFYNMRSALLQTISATNFINWSFNNPYKAGKAFANQPQYWKDFKYLMNSDYLVDRRNGLKINISENEIADAAKTSTNKAKAALNYIIQKGYAPSSFMDSFAIASGGATFYRNRINDLLSQKDAEGESIYTQEQAEEIAFKEFRDKSELSQQSSDPSKISPQQASDLGRIVLQFANTPMQYARLQKRAFQDLKNRRGNPKEHISKIIYYGVLQNVWFNFLQQAGFMMGFVEMGDEEEEKKVFDTINGTIDSLLRGIGLAGVTTSVLKNIVIDVYERSGEDRPEYQDVWLQLLAFSPAIKSKLGKFRQAAWPFDTKKGREEIFEKGFSLDNPAWRSLAKVIEGASGLPLDRLYQKAENLAAAFDDQTETWQSVAMILGWPDWQLQTEEQKGFSRAKEDPTVYSKRQQIEVLRKHGYTDDQIKELKNEEMRAKEILKVQKETGKFYKPKTTEAEQEIISKYNKYSKEEQQSILKQQGYTEKEIYSFNTEEKRVDAIRKANKKTFKRYKPSSKHVYKAPKVVSREPIIK